ncbi:MAG: SUMF1/EgtB/PvdO family nonheme iron enzyme [Bacteroidetes bacterium]|nr:SUMF1/EgtB/PvdO family nonheme iron enzyme [Bacteroidota bacterium]
MNRVKLSSLILVLMAYLSGCSGGDNGQLIGSQDRPDFNSNIVPYGMVYIPSGTFHTGPSDQDINYALIGRAKSMSIVGFFMDDTEITNNEYRQFIEYIRDSIAHTMIGGDHLIESEAGESRINWDMPIDWTDQSEDAQQLESMFYAEDERIYGRKEIDWSAEELYYEYIWYRWKDAANSKNKDVSRADFLEKKKVNIYPDTLVWVRDFTYSLNEPMTRAYFSHPAYDDYPVVGITWKQANAFCYWRTQYWNNYRMSNGEALMEEFRLPTEHEWEYAARGGRQASPYPWGGPYLRNSKGCLLANFKPGRGNYPEDGGQYTVRANAYWPNDYGLYNMAGNASEWTSSAYFPSSYGFIHDLNPDVKYDAKDDDPETMKRKVIRGGSWKDIGYFLQTGTRHWEYQDSSKSYIGFRCVLPFLGRSMNDFN